MKKLEVRQMEQNQGGIFCETGTFFIWMGGSIGFILGETCPTFPITSLDF